MRKLDDDNSLNMSVTLQTCSTLTVREPLSIEIGQSFTVTWYNYFNCKGTPEYRNRT